MLLSQNWVTSLLNAKNSGWSVTAEEMDAGYVRVGFETEGYAPIEETTGPLVLGIVETIEELTGFKKPIRYCKVNVGSANGTGELQGIVCGARNFAEGDMVVVSLPGAELPGGFKIAARETYDHVSEGMICSAAELGMADKQTKGIITLPTTAGQPGDDARAVLGLDDTVFDVNVTPDRGYALSARGLTREIASAFDLSYGDVALDPSIAGITVDVPAVAGEALPVTLSPETKAVRFGLRKVTGIDPKAKTPFWMERELLLSGQRLVNLPTDITNFVMILLGQPMHAFDAARINGALTVRNAKAGEKLTTLDHAERKLDPEDVVICDSENIQSLAGVMGGSTSEIADDTTDVYFEAAIWDPITVARTCRRHKLSSEASRRFERGVDPTLPEIALDIAASLLAQYGGGTVDAGRTMVGSLPAPATVEMPVNFPSVIAGVDYDRDTVIKRLEEVGCAVEVSECGGKLAVTAPAWRSDLTYKESLVEEVLRLEGLEAIPSIVPTAPAGQGLTPAQKRRRAVTHALAYNGYLEILPTPFIANDTFDVWGLDQDDPRRSVVTVQNPLESDHAILGTTLLPSMLDAVKRNVARGQVDVSLYGVEQVSFARGTGVSPMPSVSQRPTEAEIAELIESLPHQPLHVAVVGSGDLEPEGPWGEGRAYTYADAIEAAQVVARAADVTLELENADMLPWHPGRCAALKVDGQIVGYAGELHPQVLERAGLPARTCAMEMDITALPFEPSLPAPVLSAFPALLQDLALVVAEDTPVESVRKVVEAGAGQLLEKAELFDVYRSEQLGADKKSLAFSLVFRASDRTLTDEECNTARLAAAEAAAQAFGAEMRG
ncbi:Phenylalanine--tRNA ligase beta subunit [Corynebacterium kalinowskii]|uniref:Phenylalanine--tRNA ligase beta subunit n=1 Tax=Corynebacterium kalinowskii TaxID=2675216 RepID=A0A6B8VSD2_9CORY|nr:phenylalanine--tRNA ligase subunit beta [Corynebacterium kalinowskii]QGU01905.1 Phenylalanine--tRNA ligase beta subunit [Corynebacterium kalinowskii]